MKTNIRTVLLGEMLLLIVIFLFTVLTGIGDFSAIGWFIDLPTMILILVVLVLGLLIAGVWKDFIKSFSVGIKSYSLLELKNIIGAVDMAQKITVYAALFVIVISGILLLGFMSDLSSIGPRVATCFLAGLYALIVEFLLLPLKINGERKMHEEMDLDDE